MTQRRNIMVKRSLVDEAMSYIKNLPACENDPDSLLGLPEIFRSKEYAAFIESALRKGHTFDNIAEIFSDKFGITITGRQLKYHYTRAKNLGRKNSKSARTCKRVISLKDTKSVPERNTKEIDVSANSSSVYSGFVTRKNEEIKPKPAIYSGDMDAE